jgi:hypothetical protein
VNGGDEHEGILLIHVNEISCDCFKWDRERVVCVREDGGCKLSNV